MKAVQLISIGKPLEEREIPTPTLHEEDVLIRVRAAGICHSDAHYRDGVSPVAILPLTLGHEVAGVVEEVGTKTIRLKPGDRVCVHYVATCGDCDYCRSGNEQLCSEAEMIGKHRHGGYAELIVMPQSSVLSLPEEISFEQGAIMMCSTATSFHALRKGRLKPKQRVAIFGCGGLGSSAIQLARIMDAAEVFAVDIRNSMLERASRYGAIPIHAGQEDPVASIQKHTHGIGVDVSLELTGLPNTIRQSVQCLNKLGRAVMVGLGDRNFEINAYQELIGKEAELIGCSDHLLSELHMILDFARQKRIDLSDVIVKKIGLQANAINQAHQALSQNTSDGRTVVIP